jgi:hypothetical protein
MSWGKARGRKAGKESDKNKKEAMGSTIWKGNHQGSCGIDHQSQLAGSPRTPAQI